eukprot:2274126-Heterocapsa_arctica.AAC.1
MAHENAATPCKPGRFLLLELAEGDNIPTLATFLYAAYGALNLAKANGSPLPSSSYSCVCRKG